MVRQPRLVIVVSPAELPMGPDRMWMHIRERGRVVPLALAEDAPLHDFLARLLNGSASTERRPRIFDLYGNHRADHQFDAWVVEASDPLLRLAQGFDGWTGLSFERMVESRQALMSDVNELVTQEKTPRPRQLGERLQEMNLGALRRAAGRHLVMQDFL